MKKQLLMGFVAATLVIPAFAQRGGGKEVGAKTAVKAEYLKEIREKAFGKGGKASGLNAAQTAQATDKLILALNNEGMLTKDVEAAVRGAISTAKGQKALLAENKGMTRAEEILENLTTILAAKKTAEANKDSDLVDASKDAVKLISLTELNGQVDSKQLTKTEQALMTEAVAKIISLSTQSMSKFEGMEAKQMQKVVKEMITLTEGSSKLLPEEALVQAIMKVMKVDKKTALETAEKLKDCV